MSRPSSATIWCSVSSGPPKPMRCGSPISTDLPAWQGFLYLAVVIDAWSRRVVGWNMASHLRTELVQDAPEMALWSRRPAVGLLHHSDDGCQYIHQPGVRSALSRGWQRG